jgi:hypothetical protein
MESSYSPVSSGDGGIPDLTSRQCISEDRIDGGLPDKQLSFISRQVSLEEPERRL